VKALCYANKTLFLYCPMVFYVYFGSKIGSYNTWVFWGSTLCKNQQFKRQQKTILTIF
jgi:hypothetical protein